jgi:mannan endo-1,4-beta-mannosidase
VTGSDTEAPPVGVLEFLAGDRGGRIISAMHHDHPYDDPARADDLHRRVAAETGVYPALYSADFLTGRTVPFRGNMIDEVIRQWANGRLVQIMFHVSPPQYAVEQEADGGWGTDAAADALPGPNRVYSHLPEARWTELMTEGTELNANWRRRMDEYARHLRRLDEAGVTVLLRPFHEMNQHVFWWGGRPGPSGTAGLFRMFRRHLEDEWGLHDIVWVWNVQDLPDDYGYLDGDEKFARYRGLAGGIREYDANDWDAFNPGADAYDVLSVDFYDEEGYSPRRYEQAQRIAERDGKPMIIGETFVLPGPEVLRTQPGWALAMPWGERTWLHNTREEMAAFYRDSIGAADLPRFAGRASAPR